MDFYILRANSKFVSKLVFEVASEFVFVLELVFEVVRVVEVVLMRELE